MKRILPFLLAAVLLLPLSCKKDSEPALPGTWSFDHATMTLKRGTTSLTNDFTLKDLLTQILSLAGDDSGIELPAETEFFEHVKSIDLTIDLAENGAATARLAMKTDLGAEMAQKAEGRWVREGQTLTFLVEGESVSATIRELTDATLVLRADTNIAGESLEGASGYLDLFLIR